MPFAKGQSGNPKGRRKGTHTVELKALAQKYAPAAVARLAEIMKQKGDLRAAVAASNALLDRGFGKPQQHIEVESNTPLSVQIVTPLRKDQ